MFNRLEWMIAGRYLRARRKEGAISVIAGFSLVGILLGVGTLIVVMSVMNGFRAELINQIVGAQPHIRVLAAGSRGVENYEELANKLKTAAEVTRVAPRLEQTVLGSGPGGAGTGLIVRGLSPENFRDLPGVSTPEWSQGSIDDFKTGEMVIAIGSGVADRLGIWVGDNLTLQTPPNRTTPGGRTPTKRTYKVVYIYRMGYYPFDNTYVFLPLDKAQGLLNRRGRVGDIEVHVANPDDLRADNTDPVSIGVIGAAGQPVRVENWKATNGSFIAALDTERAAMFVILSLIILVAALNIISGLIMLVKEKGPNIGIMRTFGMTRGAILRVFFICGASIGVIGTILGVVGGVLFVTYIHDIQGFLEWAMGVNLWPVEVRGLSKIPAIMQTEDVVATGVVALVLSLLATWYPARRAARMDPVEALRYE